jgi:glycosyl transferase family 25
MRNLDGPKTSTQVLVLTCSISPAERLAHALDQANTLFGAENVSVVNGMIASDPRVDQMFDPHRARLLAKRQITRSEIAAYGTHRLAWQHVLASSSVNALIFEDDFLVKNGAVVRQVFDSAEELLSEGRNIIKLFDFPRERTRNLAIRTTVAGVPLVRWQRPRAGMVGYLISRQGAERFLSRDRIFRPVDEDIKYYWETGLDVWSVTGNPVVEASHVLGGSLLEDARSSSKKRHAMRSLQGLLLNAHRNWRIRKEFSRRSTSLRRGETVQH